MDYEKAFLTQLKNFVVELRKLYPDDEIFRISEYYLKLYSTTDPSTIIDFFKTYSEKFKKYIEDENEDFFISHDNYVTNQTDYTSTVILRLKTYWNELKNSNKKIIWKYLKVLVILSEKCI